MFKLASGRMYSSELLGQEIKPGAEIHPPHSLTPIEHCESTKGFYALDFGEKFWHLNSHRPCAHNELRALYQRVLMPVISPNLAAIAAVREQLMLYADQIESNMRPCKTSYVVESPLVYALGLIEPKKAVEVGGCPIQLDQLVEHGFPIHKRRAYRRALNDLQQAPFRERDAYVTGFVKAEKLKIMEKDGDPRLIQFRSQRFNLVFGSYTRAIEKYFYQLRDEFGLRFITKGLCERKRAQLLQRAWDRYEDPVAMAFDLSRWDAHCSVPLLKAVHDFYLRLCPEPQFAALLQHQLHNTGFTNSGWRYKSPGGVMSGDMTTALGNCLMLCGMVHALMRRLGLTDRLTLVDDGDDHCIIGNRADVERYATAASRWFEFVGHDLKVEGFAENFSDIKFCQHHPIHTVDGYQMMPDPGKVLATSSVVPGARYKTPEDRRFARAYLAEVWNARAVMHVGMPILGPYFYNLAKAVNSWRSYKGESILSLQQVHNIRLAIRLGASRRRFPMTKVEPTIQGRLEVARVYGFTIDEQLSLEQTRLGVEIPSPFREGWCETVDALQQEGPMLQFIRVGQPTRYNVEKHMRK